MVGIEFRHLRYFVAVSNHRSFSRAADHLCVTQSTISKGMRELEDRLGTLLFFRHSNKVSLTVGGWELMNYAEPVLELHRESLEEFRLTHSRPVRVAIAEMVDNRILAEGVRLFGRLVPNGLLETSAGSVDDSVEALVAGGIDAALVPLPFRANGIRAVPVSRESVLICMRADDELAALPSLKICDIAGRLRIFLDPNFNRQFDVWLIERLSREGVTPKGRLFASSVAQQLELVQRRLGLALVREHQSLLPGLITRPFEQIDWTWETGVLYRPSLRNRAISDWSKALSKKLKCFPFHIVVAPSEARSD
jgi:DNA-binding transcriptional LysR family regulator